MVVGRPRLADEPLDVISFKVPHSAALAIKRAAEQEGESRSAFLRKAALDRAESVLAGQLELGGARRRRRPDCRDCRRSSSARHERRLPYLRGAFQLKARG